MQPRQMLSPSKRKVVQKRWPQEKESISVSIRAVHVNKCTTSLEGYCNERRRVSKHPIGNAFYLLQR